MLKSSRPAQHFAAVLPVGIGRYADVDKGYAEAWSVHGSRVGPSVKAQAMRMCGCKTGCAAFAALPTVPFSIHAAMSA